MSRRTSSPPDFGRRKSSQSTTGSASSVPTIHMSSSTTSRRHSTKHNNNHHQQLRQSDSIDTILGTGHGTSRDVFETLVANDRKGSIHQSASSGGVDAMASSTRRGTLNGGQQNNANQVDYMTFAEAPAFFDLPIPLYTSSHQNNSSLNRNRRQQSISDTVSGNLDKSSMSLSQNFSEDMYGSLQDINKLNQQRQKRAEMITMKYLEPLKTFNTDEHLKNLDSTVLSPGSNNNNDFNSTRNSNNNYSSGRDYDNKNNNSSRNRSNNNNKKGSKKHASPLPPHLQTSSGTNNSARIILPRTIAEMVQSLRPTQYQPLRKAMKNRSQERFYEGDTKEPDEATKRRNEEQEQARLLSIGNNVSKWQENNNNNNQLTLSVPNDAMNDGARANGGASSSLSFGNFSHGMNEPLPVAPPGTAGGLSSASPHNRSNNYYHQTTSSTVAGGRRSNSPLQAVHAGRRPSILTAPTVGDLGGPSRTFPTHRSSPLLDSQANRDDDDDDDNTNEILHHSPNERVFESTNLLGVSSSPQRQRSISQGGDHHQPREQRLSVAVSSQELAKDAKKTDEFHRDMLAWYRTEATMLRVAM